MSRALARGLLVIETLAGADEQGLGPTAVAEAAEIDKATASRILQTLIDTGYVVRDDVTRRYRLTGKYNSTWHKASAISWISVPWLAPTCADSTRS